MPRVLRLRPGFLSDLVTDPMRMHGLRGGAAQKRLYRAMREFWTTGLR